MSDLLFNEVIIKKTKFKNRIVMPSMVTHYAAINGEVTEKLIHYHVERAKGNVGLNFLESTSVHDTGLSYTPGVSISSDYFIKGLKKLTKAVHDNDGKIGVQLNHAGRLSKPEISRYPIPLVSFVPPYTNYTNSRVLDIEDIKEIRQSFIDAAKRAVEAGFDAIEIHGAHGYLIAEFLSPLFNKREDEYGGSYENRLRFALEVVQGVRKAIGEDFPLFFRISSDEFLENGMNIELASRIAVDMAKAGIDVIHVSAGLAETNQFTGPPPCLPLAWNLKSAKKIKENLQAEKLDTLVLLAGRIVDRESTEQVLSSSFADLVTMGRATIADPHLPRKLMELKDKEVLPCIGCNEGCNGKLIEKKPAECALNPRTGYEALYPIRKVENKKNILIIGAGVAGLQAALTASENGHTVTIWEQDNKLGGLLNVASLPPHKAILRKITSYYTATLEKYSVNIVLNKQATVKDIRQFKADELLIATGSKALVPSFVQNVPIKTAAEVLEGAVVGKKVLIVGGGLIACETAEFLVEQGKEVTIIECRNTLAPDMHGRARKFLLQNLKKHNTQILTENEVCSLNYKDDVYSVVTRNKYKQEQEFNGFNSAIVAIGYKSENSLSIELEKHGMNFYAVGDCTQAGKIMTAVHTAFHLAYKL